MVYYEKTRCLKCVILMFYGWAGRRYETLYYTYGACCIILSDYFYSFLIAYFIFLPNSKFFNFFEKFICIFIIASSFIP
jgi:hypothetical protein